MPKKIFWISLSGVLALLGLSLAAILPTATAYQSSNPTPTPDPSHEAHHPDQAVSANTSLVGTIWIANEYGNSLSVIDAATNQVITTFTGVEGPHNIQASVDGRTIWAVSGHQSLALAIDAATYTLLGTVPTGLEPAHVILTPDGTKAYITDSGDNTVTVIDTTSLEVITTIPVGSFPHGLRPSPDGQWVYVANVIDGTLSVIDTSTDTKIADVEVGEKPVQVGFSPDGAFVYVSLNGENSVGKVDVATHILVDKIEVGVGPIQVFVTPNNAYLLVANQGTQDNPSTTVSLIDTATFSVINTIETGQGAHGVVIDPSGTYAYITNLYGNDMAVLDIATQQIISTIAVGEGPNGIAFSPLAVASVPSTEIALELGDHNNTEASQADDSGHAEHHPDQTVPTPSDESSNMGDMPGMMGSGDMDVMQTMMTQMQGMMDAGDMDGIHTMMDQMQEHMTQMQGMMSSGDMDAMQTVMTQMQDMMDAGDMDAMQTVMNQMQEHMTQMHSTPESGGMGDMSGMTNSDAGMGDMGHAMQPISAEGVPLATEDIGGKPLDFQLEDGVKVFEITAKPIIWNILDDVIVTAWTYNGTVPGPMIRVTEGDRVRINFKNELPEPTTIHWHGIAVPNAMDGVPGVTQDPVQPGETFTYEFIAKPAGTFIYHSHYASDTQVSIGLYAPFIIDAAEPTTPAPDVDVTMMLSEWRVTNGQTFAAMPMQGAEPNYFTINGKAFPSTETIDIKVGQRVRIRLISIGQFIHPMHLHGMPFKVVATDGYPVPEAAQLTKDTISVAPGERYDIEFVATEPGQWMFHCHILHHTTNDGADNGGLMVMINVVE